MKKHLFRALIPTLIFISFTPIFSYLDLSISLFFYKLGNNSFINPLACKIIYHWGPIPALFIGAIAVFTAISSLLYSPWKYLLAPSLYLILTLSIGSGIIINGVLKEHWHRPRPRQIQEFGGSQNYRPYYSPRLNSPPQPSKSFPSGHASMGFFFFSLSLIALRYKKRRIFLLNTLFATILSALLSLTRIAQGGHFFTDTLASGLIMWLTALFFDWWVYDKLKMQNILRKKNE